MKSIDVEYQIQVGYWATRNHLQDYKIYVTVICMFDENFLNSLLQPPRNNPWPTHSTNRNYKTQLLRQSNYLLGFMFPNKYSLEITINKKWPKNQSDPEEDKYESPTLVYFKEIDAMVPLMTSSLQLHLECKDLGVTMMSKCQKLW